MNSPLLNNIRIVLVNTTHPGNIGATARAMMNMGLSQLYLVNPEHFPDQEANARASGADEILTNAKVAPDLISALTGCGLVIGTSARTRSLTWPTISVRESAQQILTHAQTAPVAVVFGQERMGLTNAELQYCHYLIHIPAHPEFSSLNLAAAVQIIAYEIWQEFIEEKPIAMPLGAYATAEALAHFYSHLQQVLLEIQFVQPERLNSMMQRLQRLFNKAKLEDNEINILRGILTAVQKKQN